MKLTEIKILQEVYKKTITREEAIEYLKRNCSDAMKTFTTPIVRGDSTISDDFTIVTGEDGGRASRNTSNHYSVIMDEFLPKLGYPRRQASIICASYEAKEYAAEYGHIFAVFPINGAPIGVTESYDLWNTKIKIGDYKYSTQHWNSLFNDADISSKSFPALVRDLEKFRDTVEPTRFTSSLKEALRGVTDIAGELKYAYTQPFSLTTTATPQPYNRGEHEVWIGKPCLLIDWDMYLDILKDWQNEAI